MYHKGKKIYPGEYEYRGYRVRKSITKHPYKPWYVMGGVGHWHDAIHVARSKEDAYRYIDNLLSGKEVTS